MYRSHVMVCGGTGCTSSNSDKIAQAFEAEIQATGLQDEVKVIRTGCFGLCALGPIVVIYPEGSFYSMVKEENVKEIVDEHLLKGPPRHAPSVMKRRLPKTTPSKAWTTRPFYKKQLRVALRNCGVINPENIDEYIAFDGYAALGKVLTEMTPERGHSDRAGFRPARPRRRWLPHRAEVEICRRQPGGPEICVLQRRRGRPRRVHGPLDSGRRPACGD